MESEARALKVRPRTVLVVDDDDQMRRIVLRIFSPTGCHLLEANSGPAALEVAAAHDGPIDLLLTDVVLPGVDGCRLIVQMRERRPSIRVLYMSGYGPDILARYGAPGATGAFISKPFGAAALRERVRRAIEDEPAP